MTMLGEVGSCLYTNYLESLPTFRNDCHSLYSTQTDFGFKFTDDLNTGWIEGCSLTALHKLSPDFDTHALPSLDDEAHSDPPTFRTRYIVLPRCRYHVTY